MTDTDQPQRTVRDILQIAIAEKVGVITSGGKPLGEMTEDDLEALELELTGHLAHVRAVLAMISETIGEKVLG